MANANQVEFDRWNAESQARSWPKREQITICVTPVLIEALALKPGERVLDVGSGGGVASFAAARAVGDAGAVTGFDISEPLTGLANKRAGDQGLKNATFVAGDAQVGDIPGAPFDAVMSQFGVMFFSDPTAAFANIRRHLKPGGRMVFACWQPAAKNTWFPGPVLAPFVPPPQAASSGGPPPGPFAFGDQAYVRGVLERSGFSGIGFEEITVETAVEQDSLFDREMLDAQRIPDGKKEDAWAALQKHSQSLLRDDGKMHLSLAPMLVRARSA